MVKDIFKSNGAFLGAFVFGVLPIVAFIGIVLGYDSFQWLGLPVLANPFLWLFIILDKLFSLSTILNSTVFAYMIAFLIFGTNFVVGFVFGWVAEILIKGKKDEGPYYDST